VGEKKGKVYGLCKMGWRHLSGGGRANRREAGRKKKDIQGWSKPGQEPGQGKKKKKTSGSYGVGLHPKIGTDWEKTIRTKKSEPKGRKRENNEAKVEGEGGRCENGGGRKRDESGRRVS